MTTQYTETDKELFERLERSQKRRQVISALGFLGLILVVGISIVAVGLTLTVTDQSTPTTIVTKIVEKTQPIPDTILIEDNLNGWPLQKAIDQWNINGSIFFITDFTRPHLYTITIIASSKSYIDSVCGKGNWGCYGGNGEQLDLWNGIPQDQRLTVLCHELGHVLGLEHEFATGCTADSSLDTKPSQHDLDWVTGTYRWLQ